MGLAGGGVWGYRIEIIQIGQALECGDVIARN